MRTAGWAKLFFSRRTYRTPAVLVRRLISGAVPRRNGQRSPGAAIAGSMRQVSPALARALAGVSSGSMLTVTIRKSLAGESPLMVLIVLERFLKINGQSVGQE